ncbi:hypothetical protein GCM10009549_56320 [Streptomyces thermoalcalitolerans]|uniref:Gram-positive cocci surface proteins LPxTG domain-containing protein n=1 Tax=Streptomyces thermoalcalitolerans TaxID=65605 RepID=A0ABN1PS70_9ACTN
MLTATAAGTLLGALWFVPSANASVDAPARETGPAAPTTVTEQGRPVSTTAEGARTQLDSGTEVATTGAGSGTELAATGSIDTTPYVIGGTLFLALGAGFVVYSVRQERLDL